MLPTRWRELPVPDKHRIYREYALTGAIILALFTFVIGLLVLLGGYVHELRLQIKEETRQSRRAQDEHNTFIVQERRAFAATEAAFAQLLHDHQALMRQLAR